MKDFTEKMKRVFGIVNKYLEKSLFPTDMKCALCDRDVPDFENNPFCEECEKEVIFNNGNRCLICDAPIDNEAVVCDFCQRHKRNFKKAVCPFVYTGKIRSAILSYKDSGRKYLAKTFAKFIAKDLEKENVVVDRITYVPLTDKKKRKRGYDQAEILAKEVAKLLGLEVERFFVRVADGKTQKFSNFQERQQNMLGRYNLCDVSLKKTDSVLIVDDIITTGATVDYCAGLCAKKVKEVYVTAVARNKLKEKADIK